jgi:hypothetical protein
MKEDEEEEGANDVGEKLPLKLASRLSPGTRLIMTLIIPFGCCES